MGLLLAVSLTVANGGRRLIADCHPGLLDPSIPLDQGPGHTDCPFDPTRIYVSGFLVFSGLHLCPVCCSSPFQGLVLFVTSGFRIQPWLSGSPLCSCLQARLLFLVTVV